MRHSLTKGSVLARFGPGILGLTIMVLAVGSSFSPLVVTTAAASTAGLEAQIARDKKELSNCVNCESADTNQGQADIQALTNKITAAEARLSTLAAPDQSNPSTALNATSAADGVSSSAPVSPQTESQAGEEPAETPDFPGPTRGRIVDILV